MDRANTYLVVGGSSGIGLALTHRLAAEGYRVIAASRTAEHLQGIEGVRHLPYDALQHEAPLNPEIETLHGLVYLPGSINLKPFHRLKREDFLQDFELNVVGAVKVIQDTLPLLKKAERSSIVLFSTVAVAQGMSFHASVATAKGALEGLARSLAAELAPKIRVNVIAPSITDTPLAGRLLSTEDKRQASGKRHPIDRIGTPDDMAAAASFLLTDQSSWITGQVLGVDGGLSRVKSL